MPMIVSQLRGHSVENISVNFYDVSLSNTSWTIHGLNLYINDCNLVTVGFFIRHKPIYQIGRREIKIVNSTFGHLNVKGGYNILVSDCTVDGATLAPNSTLMDVVGGTLTVSTSTFHHLGAGVYDWDIVPNLLKVVRCRIHMVDVNCSNNEAPVVLIQIQNGSELFVRDSTFENNGNISSVISVKFNSSLSISDSLFSGNSASNGSCLRLHHNVSVTISQSTFINNEADYGGVIYQYYEPKNSSDQNNSYILSVTISHSTFVNNRALSGGVIYHYYETVNAQAQNHSYEENSADHTQIISSGEEETQQSLSIYNSYFVNNTADYGGVVYLYGASIDLFVKKCNFTENLADIYGSVIHAKNVTGNVVQQCLFNNNFESLYLIGTHSQLMDCEFFCDPSCPLADYFAVNIQNGTASINNCTFRDLFDTSISAFGTKLSITNSKCEGFKANCLFFGNSEVTVVGSQFDTVAPTVLLSDNWSNLTVINTSFVNGYYVFQSFVGIVRVQFINCLFHSAGTLALVGQMLLKNCTISSYQNPFFHSDISDPTVPTQLELVDCVITGNSYLFMPFIYVENASFTMINCLYTGNNIRNHIWLNGTTDVTITNVTFFNNSFQDNGDPGNKHSLFVVNNTVMEMKNCKFESNNAHFGSLMLVFGSEVRVMNSVISNNYGTNYPDYTERKLISIHDSKTVEFSSSKFVNNTGIDIFDVWSSSLLLIDNCSFESNSNLNDFDIWYTDDVILQRSRFYNSVSSSIYDVRNLRIFRDICTFYNYTFISDGNLRTKVFVLDSNITIIDYGRDQIIVTEGSPYASGEYNM